MEAAQTSENPQPRERSRWVFAFRVNGDLRYLSHADTLRLFRRAVARASLPIRFSEGFNPQPRLRIPLPRPVGIASNAECLVIEFDRPIDPGDALHRLEEQTPAGIRMTHVRRLAPEEGFQRALVRYRLEPEEPLPADLEQRLRRILDAGALRVQRTRHTDGKSRMIDIRPYLAALHVDDGAVELTLCVTPHGTARPAEIAQLIGCDAGAINHRIRRMEVQWQ